MREAGPCRRCGSTKTGSVGHGWMYRAARAFGYRLRTCGGCHRLRLIRREPDAEPEVIARPQRDAAPPLRMEAAVGCPYCGSERIRRSRRRWFDHLLKRPKMARCRDCRRRFPSPQIPSSSTESETETRKSA